MYTEKLSKLDLLFIVGWLLVGWGFVSFLNAHSELGYSILFFLLMGLLVKIIWSLLWKD